MAGPGYVQGGASSHIGDSTLVTVTVHCNVLYNIVQFVQSVLKLRFIKKCSYFSGFKN